MSLDVWGEWGGGWFGGSAGSDPIDEINIRDEIFRLRSAKNWERIMCGIVGIYSQEPVAAELHDSLIHLQHRGQDAAGILTCDQRFYPKNGLGLVREIFTPENILSLKGNIGIAHTRYPTAGGYSESRYSTFMDRQSARHWTCT